MVNLEREHKIAFARVITDLIEADFVVEADEMRFFESVISKDMFAISEAMLAEAKRMDFSKALSVLKGLDEENRLLLLGTLKQLSMSDGVCVPLEATDICRRTGTHEWCNFTFYSPVKNKYRQSQGVVH